MSEAVGKLETEPVMDTLIPALGRQSQTNLCALEANLVYITSFRPFRDTSWNPVTKNAGELKLQDVTLEDARTKKCFLDWTVVVHTFNPSTQEAEARGSL